MKVLQPINLVVCQIKKDGLNLLLSQGLIQFERVLSYTLQCTDVTVMLCELRLRQVRILTLHLLPWKV